MVDRKIILLFLLMFSVGLSPLMSPVQGSDGHAAMMTSDCNGFDLENGIDFGSCGGDTCPMSAGYCATQGGAGFPARLASSSESGSFRTDWYTVPDSRYRSRFDFSIYRPPIA